MHINVLEYLEESARNFGKKVAFRDINEAITYEDLQFKATAVGSYIHAQVNGTRKQPVVVLIDRDIHSLVAFFGVVYSGNFYAPVDRNQPPRRIQTIIDTLEPTALLYGRRDETLLTGLKFSGKPLLFEEAITQPVDNEALYKVRKNIIDTDPLCAIFTSGSTGIPKGVLKSHRSVISFIDQFSNLFGFNEDCIFGNQAPFDFDVSLKDIYSTIKHGASMCVIPGVYFSFPGQLIKYLNENTINILIWSTSALRIVENLKALENEKPVYLQKIMFSGEVMPNKVLNYWRRHLPLVQYVNLYGPTEMTGNCSYFIVDRQFADEDVLPIGIPFPNAEIILLNKKNEQIQGDEMGEICIAGSALSLGYYNAPEETAKRFCQNPLNAKYPQVIYRTGDLGKYNDRNELLFVSRMDHQIKHMGHRIELGEIEVAANSLDFIDAACCLYDHNAEKIILFYQAEKKCDIEVLQGLKQYFPKYMLPNKLIHYTQLPLNKNAKIDRSRLMESYLNESGK